VEAPKDHNVIAYTTLTEERRTQSKLESKACHVNNTNIETAAMDIQQCVISYCCRAKSISTTIIMHLGLHVKCPTFLYDFNQM
jgi:hypothetical protein